MAAWGIDVPPDKYLAHSPDYTGEATMHEPAWEVFI
jgi:hypothetical protein